VRLSITYCWLTTFELIEPADYEELAVRVTEVKRMLAVLIGQLSTSHRNSPRPRVAES